MGKRSANAESGMRSRISGGSAEAQDDPAKVAKRLTESELRFRALVEASSDVVYRVNADWSSMELLIGRNFISDSAGPRGNWLDHYLPDEEKDLVSTAIAAAIRDKSIFELKHRVIRMDGSVGWIISRAIPILDTNGEIVEWFGMAKDITDRVITEEMLHRSEERLRLAMEASHEGIWDWNWTTGDVYYSPRYADILGYEASGIQSDIDAHVNLLHPDDRERIFQEGRDALSQHGIYSHELRIRRSDGTYIWILMQSKVVERDATGQVLRVIGTVSDITEQIEGEVALRASEQKFRNLFENMTEEVQIWTLDRDESGAIVRWHLDDVNPAGLRRWGRTREETVGRSDDELFPGATERFLPIVQKIFEDDAPYSWESHVPWGDRYLRMTTIPLGNSFINTGVDVTKYRQLQEELSSSKQMLELALAGAELGTWDLNFATGKVTLDVRFCQIIGYTPDEIAPTMDGWLGLLHPDDLANVKVAMAEHTAGETPTYEAEYRLRHKQGHWVWLSARGRVIRDKEGQPLRASGIVEDISRRKRVTTEGKELLQRMEALIAGLNHRVAPGDVHEGAEKLAKSGLSARNLEVLSLTAQGMTAAEIGRRLFISSETVVTHRQTIMRKLGLRNKAELIRYALEHKVVKT